MAASIGRAVHAGLRLAAGGLVIAAAGCGAVLATIPIADEAPHETMLTVPHAGELSVWSLFDAEWIGPMSLQHDLTLVDATGTVVSRTTCDPLRVWVKLRSVGWHWQGRHKVHEEGRMDCRLSAPAPGKYALRESLTIAMVPEGLRLTQASIRIRQ